MGLRGGCAAALALVLGRLAGAAADEGRELRSVELRRAVDGTTVVIELTRPSMPRFAVVRGQDGELRRIHVDLPTGTRITSGVVRSDTNEPPVTGVRVGLVDTERARIVIDVDGATDYRIERDAAPTAIVLTVLGRTTAAQPDTVGVPNVTRPRPAPALAPPTTVRRARDRPRIVIDPGHGGDDPGAEGFVVEKLVTLDIAQRLAAMLRARLGAEVVLTRDDDRTLALKERTALANGEGADLFVSIHANANPTGLLRGVETYYLDNSTDKATLRLATMENELDLLRPKGGEASLRYILSDLVQVGKLEESMKLARHVQRGLVGHLRRRYPGVVDLGVKRGPFYVLVGAFMPCVLVETAFLTNPIEGRRLARDAYRDDVAQGLYTGIARFLADASRRRTL